MFCYWSVKKLLSYAAASTAIRVHRLLLLLRGPCQRGGLGARRRQTGPQRRRATVQGHIFRLLQKHFSLSLKSNR